MVKLKNIMRICKKNPGRTIFLQLPRKEVSKDVQVLEVIPGIKGKIIIHGHKKGKGRKYIPTIVKIDCKDFI